MSLRIDTGAKSGEAPKYLLLPRTGARLRTLLTLDEEVAPERLSLHASGPDDCVVVGEFEFAGEKTWSRFVELPGTANGSLLLEARVQGTNRVYRTEVMLVAFARWCFSIVLAAFVALPSLLVLFRLQSQWQGEGLWGALTQASATPVLAAAATALSAAARRRAGENAALPAFGIGSRPWPTMTFTAVLVVGAVGTRACTTVVENRSGQEVTLGDVTFGAGSRRIVAGTTLRTESGWHGKLPEGVCLQSDGNETCAGSETPWNPETAALRAIDPPRATLRCAEQIVHVPCRSLVSSEGYERAGQGEDRCKVAIRRGKCADGPVDLLLRGGLRDDAKAKLKLRLPWKGYDEDGRWRDSLRTARLVRPATLAATREIFVAARSSSAAGPIEASATLGIGETTTPGFVTPAPLGSAALAFVVGDGLAGASKPDRDHDLLCLPPGPGELTLVAVEIDGGVVGHGLSLFASGRQLSRFESEESKAYLFFCYGGRLPKSPTLVFDVTDAREGRIRLPSLGGPYDYRVESRGVYAGKGTCRVSGGLTEIWRVEINRAAATEPVRIVDENDQVVSAWEAGANREVAWLCVPGETTPTHIIQGRHRVALRGRRASIPIPPPPDPACGLTRECN